jgi:hypothetical protein
MTRTSQFGVQKNTLLSCLDDGASDEGNFFSVRTKDGTLRVKVHGMEKEWT